MMNIETLLQAAQILENQQSIPPKKRLARGDRQTSTNVVPTSILSPTIINTNPTIFPPPSSILKNDHPDEYSQVNLNQHHLSQKQFSSFQQHFPSDPKHDLGDDDDEDDDQNTDGNSDTSNRTQTTTFRDREIHNRLEKHRRAHLKDCFDGLKAEVPCQKDRKITNLQVLKLAIKYVQTLSRKKRDYEQEMATLRSRHLELQERLSALKSELNSEGHDVDTWLDSCSNVDRSISTCTASEAEMYRTIDDEEDYEEEFNASTTETELLNGHGNLDTNNNQQHHGIKSNLNNSYTGDSKILLNHRKTTTTTRQRPRPSKRKLTAMPTTNLLQTLPTRSENLIDYSIAKHLRLDQPCHLLTTVKDNLSSTAGLTPITDIRYEIVDMFTKGVSSHLQQQQQASPLPSIASLMNRHSSPIVSPTKQTIGINTDPLTTSTTNILHQTVSTS